MTTIQLANNIEIPPIGMGTYPLFGNVLTSVIHEAYQAGYRLFDTADNYYNETDLGNSLVKLYKTSSAIRDELFLVSKISDELYKPGTLGGGSNKGVYFWKDSPAMKTEKAVSTIIRKKLDNSLHSLHTEYLDLLLMHWPYPDYFEEIWYELENLYKEGKVKAIGVCNCRERHFEKLKKNSRILPMVNQFESSPLNTKTSLVNYCNQNNIRIMTYSPLMSLHHPTLKGSSLLKSLADKYKKNLAQIILRFDIQRGLIPIPKSTHKDRIQDNINIFDFELTAEKISSLLLLNENYQTLPESKSCPGL